MLLFSVFAHLLAHVVKALLVSFAFRLLVDLHLLEVFKVVLALLFLLFRRLLELAVRVFLRA